MLCRRVKISRRFDTTHRHIPDDLHLQEHSCDKLYVVLAVHLITVENVFYFTNLCTISYNSINLVSNLPI
jgi:hypothetical protein